MTRREVIFFLAIVVAFVVVAYLPFVEDSGYLMSLALPIAMYTVLATSWALYSLAAMANTAGTCSSWSHTSPTPRSAIHGACDEKRSRCSRSPIPT